jgi:hypothetical protein
MKVSSAVASLIPTPLVLAARSAVLRSRESLESIHVKARESFPELLWVAQQAGVDILAHLELWIQSAGAASAADWVDGSTSGFQLASRCREAGLSMKLPLLARLIQEEQLSTRAAVIAPYLRAHRLTLEFCLLRARTNVAAAAFETAFESSERRTVFARTLQLARQYSKYVVDADELAGRERNPLLNMRLGIATVLTARFSAVTDKELGEACATLRETYQEGADRGIVYFLEGCLWRYDAFESLEALLEGARIVREHSGQIQEASWLLNASEIWIKLAGCASSLRTKQRFLSFAREALDLIEEKTLHISNESLAYEMQDTYLSFLEERVAKNDMNLGCRGVRFPFVLRTSHIRLPEEFFQVAELIALRLSKSSKAGSYIYRDVSARSKNGTIAENHLADGRNLTSKRKCEPASIDGASCWSSPS